MGLFKVYHGPAGQIDSIAFHDGYAYFSEEDNLFYIDYIDSDSQQIRAKIRADQVVKSDGTVIQVDDLLTASAFAPTPFWEWGDETGDADADWWAGLAAWLGNASDDDLAAQLGKTKSVTLSSAIKGTATHLVRCIGYNCDGNKTLTFQTANCLKTKTAFGTSNALWIGSTVRSLCGDYYNAFPGKASIKTVSKGTCASTDYSQAGTPTYNDETVFLPSDCEMGFQAGRDQSNGLGYAASYDEYCANNTGKTAYQYYTTNDRRIKKLRDSGGNTGYWERSLNYNATGVACFVSGDGKPNYGSYGGSYGFAPAFVIGATASSNIIIPVDKGGTGATTVEDARANLGVYSTTEVDTKAVTKTFGGGTTAATKIILSRLSWNQDDTLYRQDWSESSLRCGASGSVPPLVAPLTNKSEWSKMDHADATAGSGIAFYATSIPSEDIEIIVVDLA